jgi:hypothetical protein
MAAKITQTDIFQILIIAVVVYFVYTNFLQESFEAGSVDQQAPQQPTQQPQPQPQPQPEPIMQGISPEQQAQQINQIIQEKPQLSAEELLPKYDEANEFAKQNPVSDLLKEQNFLISGYHMGINTVMQSNKIPFHDLRSAPPIPKQNVGPFLQSSYETPAGTNRRSLEIL